MNEQTSYTLSDDVIAHVAKLLQLAILSGTDVVDHLRMVKLENSNENNAKLVLNTDYSKNSDEQIEKMLSEVKNYREQFEG